MHGYGYVSVYFVLEIEGGRTHRTEFAEQVALKEIKSWKELDRRLSPLEESGIGDLTFGDEGKMRIVSETEVMLPPGPGQDAVDRNGRA